MPLQDPTRKRRITEWLDDTPDQFQAGSYHDNRILNNAEWIWLEHQRIPDTEIIKGERPRGGGLNLDGSKRMMPTIALAIKEDVCQPANI